MGNTTQNTDHLTRAQLYSSELRELLLDDLLALSYVEMVDFPDGDTMNIASIGQGQVNDYVEDTAVTYNALDTGNFQFSIDEYKQSGNYITNKELQDSHLSAKLVSGFVPKQHRAIAKQMELDIFNKINIGQTANDPNVINAARHRLVAGGAAGTLTHLDFAKAMFALKQANVPQSNLIAIVDPTVEFAINKIAANTNVAATQRWDTANMNSVATGTKFIANIMGFDVYTSQNLVNNLAETISGASVTAGTANLFFSAASDYLPVIGAMRQMPTVDSEYNKDMQREEYVTTARYGFKLQHEDNLVTILSETDQVYV